MPVADSPLGPSATACTTTLTGTVVAAKSGAAALTAALSVSVSRSRTSATRLKAMSLSEWASGQPTLTSFRWPVIS